MDKKEFSGFLKKELQELAKKRKLTFSLKDTKEELISLILNDESTKFLSKTGSKVKKLPKSSEISKSKKIRNKKESESVKNDSSFNLENLMKLGKSELLLMITNQKLGGSAKNSKEQLAKILLSNPAKPESHIKQELSEKASLKNGFPVPLKDKAFQYKIPQMPSIKYQSKIPDEEKNTFYENYLPEKYSDDRFVIMVKNPETIFLYWDIDFKKHSINVSGNAPTAYIRLFEIQNENEKGLLKEFEINLFAASLYVNVEKSGIPIMAELIFSGKGNQEERLVSNKVELPNTSTRTVFQKDHGTNITLNPEIDFSNLVSSHSFTPAQFSSSELQKNQPSEQKKSIQYGNDNENEIWLEAKTDLILFGKTNSENLLEIGGKRVTLKADGTFSVRLSFPDSEQEISVISFSPDKKRRKEIVKKFTKLTFYKN